MAHSVGTALLPSVRVQVHHALHLLAVPAASGLIVAVRAAFSDAVLGATDLTTGDIARLLREDEQAHRTEADRTEADRAGSAGPDAAASSPYRLCPALTAAHLAPAPGLLTVSAWPLERRIVGPRSRRVHLLVAVVRLADQARRMPGASRLVTGLLRGFADQIPGALEGFDAMRPWTVAEAARAELAGCVAADAADRERAARRARAQLSGTELLYGVSTPASAR